MSQAARTGLAVINYDEVWGDAADPRLYHVGKFPHRVALGRNGVPQATVIYALCGAATAFVTSHMPAVGVLVSWPSPWIAGLVITALFGAASLPRPNGLRVHVFLPIVLADLSSPKHWLGWDPVDDPGAAWQPDQLIFTSMPQEG